MDDEQAGLHRAAAQNDHLRSAPEAVAPLANVISVTSANAKATKSRDPCIFRAAMARMK